MSQKGRSAHSQMVMLESLRDNNLMEYSHTGHMKSTHEGRTQCKNNSLTSANQTAPTVTHKTDT